MFLFRRKNKPVIIPRQEHNLSRRDIDPDALKVLYRLASLHHRAYLVGGSVRDLLLGRAPKDFDVGTDARPNEIRRQFRNCFLVGRRFRLAHIVFGKKVIETATFRKAPDPKYAGSRIEWVRDKNAYAKAVADELKYQKRLGNSPFLAEVQRLNDKYDKVRLAAGQDRARNVKEERQRRQAEENAR